MEKLEEYDESFADIDKFQDNVRHLLSEMEKRQLGLTEQQFVLEEALKFVKNKRKEKYEKSRMADKKSDFFENIMPRLKKETGKILGGEEDGSEEKE